MNAQIIPFPAARIVRVPALPAVRAHSTTGRLSEERLRALAERLAAAMGPTTAQHEVIL
ncbi:MULTISPECIES: hypothetical protein [unclassified Stenotrophomonas maltophilia group]|uniref:hypothetical protein n=1 Tax=unclassified Stenotrophomonas maltophilia group TaxID=2961925 RepID=UPI0015E04BDC